MSRLIDADALYEQLKQDEEMARNRVLDTESSLPYPNNLNPSYTRYVAQMDERTRLKHMVADAPTIEERKRGEWIPEFDGKFTGGAYWFSCSKCKRIVPEVRNGGWNFCPTCGADMRGGQE